MINSRLSPFLGKPVLFNNLYIYSPSVEQIEQIGEIEYRINLILATFDKEKILLNLFSVSEESYEEIENEDNYKVLTDNIEVANYICGAISFFTRTKVLFDIKNKAFYIDEENRNLKLVNEDNYIEFVDLLLFINGSDDTKKKPMKFKNKRSEKLFKEMAKLRKKNDDKKNDSIELKDILSIICNDTGNGVNIFNVHSLTIYQVYEHFERTGIKIQRDTMLPIWANGYLKEGTKLPEIITKTKM